MDASYLLTFGLWLFLLFAIPSACYSTYTEIKGRTMCSSLMISMMIAISFMGYAFYVFTKVCFPEVSTSFL
jgi:hypothetical protein